MNIKSRWRLGVFFN